MFLCPEGTPLLLGRSSTAAASVSSLGGFVLGSSYSYIRVSELSTSTRTFQTVHLSLPFPSSVVDWLKPISTAFTYLRLNLVAYGFIPSWSGE